MGAIWKEIKSIRKKPFTPLDELGNGENTTATDNEYILKRTNRIWKNNFYSEINNTNNEDIHATYGNIYIY